MSDTTEPVTRPIATPLAGLSGLHAPIAAATVLIAYSFLGGLWLNRHGHSPEWLVVVREWFNKPLGLGEDFGLLAIALLLMSCGHVLAARAVYESQTALARRLAWQVLPPAAISFVVGLLFTLFADPLRLGFDYRANPLSLGLLAGLLFTVSLVLCSPLLPRQWHFAAVAQLAAITFVVTAAGITGAPQLGIFASLLTLPVIGQLLWLFRSGLARFWEVTPLVVFLLALQVVAEHLFRDARDWWFPVATVCALMSLLISLRGRVRAVRARPVDWLVSRALYLVLLCGTLAYPLVGLLDVLTLPISYAFSLLVWGLVAELMHRTFGKPA